MNLWFKFMAFKFDPNAPTAGIATYLKDIYNEMKTLNVRMSSDAFLGFILQSSIMASQAGFRTDFEQQVEAMIQCDPDMKCPFFTSLLHLMEICLQQYLLSPNSSVTPFTSAQSNSTSMLFTSKNLSSDDFNIDAFLADIEQPDWSDALDFYTLTAHKCWSCGGENHYARNCPSKNKQQQRQPIGTIVGTIYGHLPSGLPVNSS